MSTDPPDRPHMRPGQQPYDPLSGMRVGAVAGGLVGAIAVAVIGATSFWWVLVAAVIGGAIGWWAARSTADEDDE